MYLLAFETSFGQFSISLFKNDKLADSYASGDHNQQAEQLIPYVERLLAANAISYKDLSYIAVGIGPGSFTGVRIGMSAAKGMALAGNIKTIGITSLEAAAYDNGGGKIYLNASRGDAFFQEFDQNLQPLSEAVMLPYEGEFHPVPDSTAIGYVALKNLDRAELPLEPLYIRKPDAKFKLRPATDADAEWLAELHAGAFNPAWSINVIKSTIADETVTIAGQLGFIAYRISGEECELKTIVTTPQTRRRGIGIFLMQELLAQCVKKQVTNLFLEVEESNLPALKLYEKLGFKTIATRADYYGQNRNALIMKYPILGKN